MTFAVATGDTLIAGCCINSLRASYRELSLLVVTEPGAEHQSLTKASYFNLSTITQCNIDSPVALCTSPSHATTWQLTGWLGLMWMLAWGVLNTCDAISCEHP